MKGSLLIVEDEYIVANDLKMILENAGYTVCDIADSVLSAKQAIDKHQPDWVLLDIFLQDNSLGTDLAPYLQTKGIGYIYLSANTNQSVLEMAKATQPYGFMVKPFRVKDLLIMLDIAITKHESNIQFELQKESILRQHLKDLYDHNFQHENVFLKLPKAFQSLIPFDVLCFTYQNDNGQTIVNGGFFRTGFDEYQELPSEKIIHFATLNTSDPKRSKGQKNTLVETFTGKAFKALQTQEKERSFIINQYHLNSLLQCCITDDMHVQLQFFSNHESTYHKSHVALLYKTAIAILKLFKTLPAKHRNNQLTSSKQISKAQTLPVLKPTLKFEGILGNSAALLQVLDNVELVANTPVTVLILGESGTGKEKIALNIHRLSSRKASPFVVVNCAALPAELVESELFGHEKGAFTGALEKRIGKFETANGGTIFLDEIGEIPVASQVKLLRILQEKQFERIGNSKTIHVDVRIIAATNRNLEKEVAEGRFRLDLFYRLNVYPIELPPLKDRKEDIPVLARHFLEKSANTIGRSEVPQLSESALNKLMAYNWPGNIRELEHLMERTLLKTKQQIIEEVFLPDTLAVIDDFDNTSKNHKTLEQVEAEHILSVLRSCKGKISGSGGAAAILGLPSSTLVSKMKKLGIQKYLLHQR